MKMNIKNKSNLLRELLTMFISGVRIRTSEMNIAYISITRRDKMKMRLNELADVITVGQIMSRVAYKDEEEKHEGKEVRVLVPSAISGVVPISKICPPALRVAEKKEAHKKVKRTSHLSSSMICFSL